MLKSILGVIVVLAVVSLILSFVLGVGIITAIAVMLVLVFAPVLGVIVMTVLPLPGFLRAIIGISLSIILIIFGLRYLGVV